MLQGPKIFQIYAERSKTKHMKKDYSKITTTYIEHKHKNFETSVLINPRNVEKQYH